MEVVPMFLGLTVLLDTVAVLILLYRMGRVDYVHRKHTAKLIDLHKHLGLDYWRWRFKDSE